MIPSFLLTMTERSRLLQTRQFKDSVHDYGKYLRFSADPRSRRTVSFSPWICSFIDTYVSNSVK